VIRLTLTLLLCYLDSPFLTSYPEAKSKDEVGKRALKPGNYQLITNRRVVLVFVSLWEPPVMLLSGGFEISFIEVKCCFALVTHARLLFVLLRSMLTKLCRLNVNLSSFNDVESQLTLVF